MSFKSMIIALVTSLVTLFGLNSFDNGNNLNNKDNSTFINLEGLM